MTATAAPYTPVLNDPKPLIRSRLKGGVHFGPDPRVVGVRHKLFRASLEELTAFAARIGIELPPDCDQKGAAQYLYNLEKKYHRTENPIVEDVVDLAAWDKGKFEPADFRGGTPAAPHALDIRPGETPEQYQARLIAYANGLAVTSAPTTIPAPQTPPTSQKPVEKPAGKPNPPDFRPMSFGDIQSWCADNEVEVDLGKTKESAVKAVQAYLKG